MIERDPYGGSLRVYVGTVDSTPRAVGPRLAAGIRVGALVG